MAKMSDIMKAYSDVEEGKTISRPDKNKFSEALKMYEGMFESKQQPKKVKKNSYRIYR